MDPSMLVQEGQMNARLTGSLPEQFQNVSDTIETLFDNQDEKQKEML